MIQIIMVIILKMKYQMEVYNLCNNSIQLLEIILKMIEENNLQNDQKILDWLDKINSISVKW